MHSCRDYTKYTRHFLLFSIILYIFSITNSLADTQRVYNVGIVPQFETKRLHSIWRPVLDRLEIETGLKFKLLGSPSIPEFEKEFLAGKFDFAYMNPYHLSWSHETVGYRPLIRDHSKKLQGILVIRKDKPISDINQLDGKNVAFPAPNALGASLLLRAELHNKFNINIIPRYVKTHDSVYLNVVTKQTMAGGGVQKTLNRQKPAIREKLKILYKTQKVAPHPFSAHPRVDEKIVLQVQQAMLNLGLTEIDKNLLARIPIKKIGIATMNDYLPLSKMGLEKFRAE